MHAIRQYAYGPPDVLRFEEVDDPVPGAGEVRMAVEAAGVHLVDTVLRAGSSGGGPIAVPDLPMTPGREVAGVVDALGAGVPDGRLGTRVVAHLGPRSGGYASRAIAAVDALHRLPPSLDARTAVAMIGTGRMTMGVLELARLRSDDVVLVTSAAGGMGTLLVQAARHAGATVVGVAGGPAKVARVRANGADVAVDHHDPAALRDGPAVTVVLDGVGGTIGRAAFDLLRPGGRILLYGLSAGAVTAFGSGDLLARGLTAVAALGPPILRLPGGLRALEERALAAAAAGTLVPAVTTFALRDAAGAHEALERSATVGKVVLLP